MASTIRTMNLVCEAFVVPVALRGASEKKDVPMGRAIKELVAPAEVDEAGEIITEALYAYRKVRQLLVGEPGEEMDALTIEPLRRDKKGKVEGVQFDGETVPGVWDDDTFIEIDASDVEKIEEMTTVSELVIQEFVDCADIPWERAMSSYFLAPPSNSGSTALRYMAMLRESMEAEGVAGVAKLMPKSRQKLAVIYPKHGGLMVTVLSYADTFQQVRDGAASFEGVATNPQVVEWMRKLIALKRAPVEVLDEYRDDLIDLRSDLIDRVKMGQPLVDDDDEQETVEAPKVVAEDALMANLRASVEALRPVPKKATAKKATAKKKPPAKKAAAKSGSDKTRSRRPAKV